MSCYRLLDKWCITVNRKDTRLNRIGNQRRTQSGSIGLTLCVLTVIMIFGLNALWLMGIIDGARQLQNATDSAALNVSKQQIKLDVALNPGLEQQNFSCVADNGKINLLNYNRVIGQLLLVSLNAEAEQSAGSVAGLSHANQLFYAVQGGDCSLSERLASRLMDSACASTPFDNMLAASNLGMLRSPQYQHEKYSVAYVNAGECTNVYLDQGLIPQGANLDPDCLSKPRGKAAHQFIKGYKGINIGGTFTLEGAPVMPGCAPHLVSNNKFTTHTKSPMTGGFVPPNCFQSACRANVRQSQLGLNACAIVGSLQSESSASIPGGYIELTNGGSSTGTIMEVLCKAGLDAQNNLIPQVVQRLRQIQPDVSEDDAVEWLDNVKLAAGKKVYLCLDPQSKEMMASTTTPPGYVSETTPDGSQQTYGNADLTTLTYTPSSGYNNLLGVIQLQDNTEHFGLAEREAQDKAESLAAKKPNQEAQLRAAVDRVKAAAALRKAQADEKRMQEYQKDAQSNTNAARSAAEAARKAQQLSRQALQAAQSDLAKAHSDKEKALALEKEAAAEKRLAQSDNLLATKEKALEEKETQQAEADRKLAAAEGQRADKEREQAAKDQHLAQLAMQQAEREQQAAQNSMQSHADQTSKSVVAPKPMALVVNNPTEKQTVVRDAADKDNMVKQQLKVTRGSAENSQSESVTDGVPHVMVQNYKWN